MDNSEIEEELFHMFDGSFKAQEELEVGDQLMGDDSLPCTITSISTIEEECFSVTPVKGDTYTIGISDTLSLYCIPPFINWYEKKNSYVVIWFDKDESRTRKTYFNKNKFNGKENSLIAAEEFVTSLDQTREITISLRKYFKKNRSSMKDCKGYKVPLNFAKRDFTFDPYFIGYWLGDGSKTGPILTIGDEDKHMVEYFAKYFKDNFDMDFSKNGISYRFINSENNKTGKRSKNILLDYLRDKDLYENKHIPIEFLHSSRESRLRLLAGLIDSDGHLDNNNTYDFVQKSEQLFDDVIYLARSLGFSCYKAPCKKTCTNAKGGPKTGDYFRCTISGKGIEEIPCMIPRKKAHVREQIKDVLVTGITIESIGECTNYRIKTDKPRFLLSDFTVRHRYVPNYKYDDDDD